MQYLVGLDNGGTSSKAVLFDENGRTVASASRMTPMETPKVGYTERDMELLWRMNCEVVRETIEKSGISAGDIAGVSFSGHGKGLYLWGKDEKPAYPGIVSTDSRAYQIVENWYKDGAAEKAFKLTNQSVLACQPVALSEVVPAEPAGGAGEDEVRLRRQGLRALPHDRGALRRDHRHLRFQPGQPRDCLLR